ncbi:hypothetical protein DPX16_1564 [Anabarilius grahami]|uniref:Uncharacterized protein n=1 Tax=Anabarilius grahami TaxID=495550 RepID=A0A3N0Z9Q4_ANAGA|nr:hypothetical protein DPX16_1564 [Anabarilius grahami]
MELEDRQMYTGGDEDEDPDRCLESWCCVPCLLVFHVPWIGFLVVVSCYLFPRWIVLWFSPTDYTALLHGHTSPVTTHRISHRPSRSLRHHSPAVFVVSYL